MCLVKPSGRPRSCLCLEELFPTENTCSFSPKFPPKHPLAQIILYAIIQLSAADTIPHTSTLPELICIYPVQSMHGFTLRTRIEKYSSFVTKLVLQAPCLFARYQIPETFQSSLEPRSAGRKRKCQPGGMFVKVQLSNPTW